MLSSQLLPMKNFLTENEYNLVIDYLKSCSRSSKINPIKFSLNQELEISLVNRVLTFLVDNGTLDCLFTIRCPECGVCIKEINDITEIDKTIYCYSCEEKIEISTDNVIVLYTYKNYPFRERQQNNIFVDDSVALEKNESLTLTQILESHNYDLNKEFFNPSNDEYLVLEKMYNAVFEKHNTTKSKGDSLENLVCFLFSLCKHFEVSNCVKTRSNQIDCYVRNKLFVPGISPENCKDSIQIECKNENKKPSITYLNKLHSILKTTGGHFGIIVSRCQKPSTYNELANKIYLRDEILIVSVDNQDLKSIILERKNLLELLEKRIMEVKLDATRDLAQLRLYNV